MDFLNFIFIAWEVAICFLFFSCVAMWRQPRVKITDKLGEIARELETQTEIAQKLITQRVLLLKSVSYETESFTKAKAKNALS